MYELKIALRQVLSRRRQTLFAILAVALAVAVITVMMAMLSGFQDELVTSSIENNPHIVINPQDEEEEFIHLYRHASARIAEKEGVIAVSPKYLGQAALEYRDNAEGVSLQGVDPVAEENVMRVNEDVVEGDLMTLVHTRYGILLGDKLAENLEVHVGDRVDAVFPGSQTTSFKVIGLIHTGTAADEVTAYTRLDSAQDFFNEPGVVSTIGVRVVDPYQAEVIAASIEGETGLDAVSWSEANAEILSLLDTQMVFVNIFYLLIYGIAGFGIANTLITIVAQRTREIGILKAMGASQKSIMVVFLFQSLVLGAIGLVLGTVLGYIVTVALQSYEIEVPQEMYFGLQTLPLEVKPLNFVYASFFAFIINIISGIYPARKAAKLDPVTAIESA
ncbi:ABC transporter permease [Methanosarcina sp. 2.H.T.1A.6]|uniref:ABC transporter permease n=1 Tax=unclassified Methanosarcina TaxID=2644672 RepID=UPI0006217A19|nr:MULTISPECIES: ABC transporter permease [unclassified Methanosarcina]KKG13281.1 ABC transporter permease [Methanosarcina sp. 2.H.T.1A.15]KKG15656.1 ABC transporter permease [Methanosarcina sp. 2.H.T.1A.3]KKG24651.1 ABC transporter permease [Methanosarcina sp. 2.H.T.1A.6]KKG25751.1 ABC transporter permease [Methanosarcina sp. 2.H.T.1A.8]